MPDITGFKKNDTVGAAEQALQLLEGIEAEVPASPALKLMKLRALCASRRYTAAVSAADEVGLWMSHQRRAPALALLSDGSVAESSAATNTSADSSDDLWVLVDDVAAEVVGLEEVLAAESKGDAVAAATQVSFSGGAGVQEWQSGWVEEASNAVLALKAVALFGLGRLCTFGARGN